MHGASTAPIATTGRPRAFVSSQSSAASGDDVGHGTRTSPSSASRNCSTRPFGAARALSAAGAPTGRTAPPSCRCPSTPSTVAAKATATAIATAAYSTRPSWMLSAVSADRPVALGGAFQGSSQAKTGLMASTNTTLATNRGGLVRVNQLHAQKSAAPAPINTDTGTSGNGGPNAARSTIAGIA